MSQPASRMLSADMLQKKEAVILDWTVLYATGVPALIAPQLGYPILQSDAAITQATVNAFLGISSSIVATTAFGSTAMGTDAYGFVIDMKGQAASALWLECVLYDTARIFKYVTGQGTDSTVLANTLTQGFVCDADGNLYGRLIPTGADGASLNMRVRAAIYLK